MTRKQLESIIRFSSEFKDPANDISVVNEHYGLSLTDQTSPSQAVTAYLEAKGIRLEGEEASLLDHFAGQAMQGLLSNEGYLGINWEDHATTAYRIAKEMLKARQEALKGSEVSNG